MASVTFDHVTKSYDGTVAVNDLSLEVSDGEFMVLVGPSGCGKTTALRMIAGLEQITDGRLLIGERVVNNVAPVNRDIAMVFQSYALYPHMTVFDNLAFGLRNKHVARKEVDDRVKHAAGILGLDPLLKRKPKQLSGGQRQRVALARALITGARVVVLDDPLSAVDTLTERRLVKRLRPALEGKTVLVATQRLSTVELADRAVVLVDGLIVESGTPADLLRAGGAFAALFGDEVVAA
jgi:ABC-type sugar transport system ATPase subunit